MLTPTPVTTAPELMRRNDDDRRAAARAKVAAAARSGQLRPAEPRRAPAPSWWPRTGLRWRMP
jgi:hypothetical protein